jgi:hypothetical protein
LIAFGPAIAEKFCERCSWVHTVWSMQKAFEEDSRTAVLMTNGYGYLFENIARMSVEHTLLEMAKLHDPACQQQRVNLSLEYIIEYGGWDSATTADLRRLFDKMREQFECIRYARNRAIAHNDLATILADAPLGAFPAGMDVDYFNDLESFATIVRDRVCGKFFEFTAHARSDVLMLLGALSRSVESDS